MAACCKVNELDFPEPFLRGHQWKRWLVPAAAITAPVSALRQSEEGGKNKAFQERKTRGD